MNTTVVQKKNSRLCFLYQAYVCCSRYFLEEVLVLSTWENMGFHFWDGTWHLHLLKKLIVLKIIEYVYKKNPVWLTVFFNCSEDLQPSQTSELIKHCTSCWVQEQFCLLLKKHGGEESDNGRVVEQRGHSQRWRERIYFRNNWEMKSNHVLALTKVLFITLAFSMDGDNMHAIF